jgi:hypothetical protein|tara:strand:+ start:193 stop:426 length:234 start_codon:yes stop_codon:yes gene_type:complete
MNKEIIQLIKERLEKGKSEYGGEVDIFDGRDWEKEALEEILDSMVYLAAALLKKMKSDSRLINILSEKKGIQQDMEC